MPIEPRKYPAIPHPSPELESLVASVSALKAAVEILTAQRGTRATGVCTLQDLVDLDLIDQDEIPT